MNNNLFVFEYVLYINFINSTNILYTYPYVFNQNNNLTDVDEVQKQVIKDAFVKYDRSLLISDRRRCEAKQFGGKGARSKRAKSYR